MTRTRRFLLLLLLVTAVAAHGGGPTASAATAMSRVCEMPSTMMPRAFHTAGMTTTEAAPACVGATRGQSPLADGPTRRARSTGSQSRPSRGVSDRASTSTTPSVNPRTGTQVASPWRAGASMSRIGGVRATKAGPGGASPVRVGQAGEDAVRDAYEIGPKIKIDVGGRKRIPDGLTPSTLSEVKNVASLSYSSQLRDFAQYAQQTGRSFDLCVRRTTRLSGPLQRAARPGGPINLRFIP